MSNENERLTCSVCHAYLFEDDDVVHCPVCGAPHHRDCYKGLGHCAFEDKHGTDEQYKKPDFSKDEHKKEGEDTQASSVKCEICGAQYPADSSACTQCGAPNFRAVGGRFVQFDFLGGVPEDMDLGDGVTAAQARRFVFTNTRRYIPKFAEMRFGKKTGWNWFAFLFPCGWFLSRKMYFPGIVTGLLSVCCSLLMLPFQLILSNNTVSDNTSIYETIPSVVSNLAKSDLSVLILLALGVFFDIILHLVCGIFGDRIYRNHAISNIKKMKEESEDIDYDYRKKGGTNFLLLILGVFAVQYTPGILAVFFK